MTTANDKPPAKRPRGRPATAPTINLAVPLTPAQDDEMRRQAAALGVTPAKMFRDRLRRIKLDNPRSS